MANTDKIMSYNYQVLLTGSNEDPVLADLPLTVSSLSATLRQLTDSFLRITLPVYTDAVFAAIQARSNGRLKVRRSLISLNADDNGEFIDDFEVKFNGLGYDRGGRNESITLTATGTLITTKAVADSFTVSRHESKYISGDTANSFLNYEGADGAFFNVFPGDTVTDGIDSGTVDLVELNVSPTTRKTRVRVTI